MTAISRPKASRSPTNLPPLYNGDRMKQPEFHRRYEAYPEDVKFELIGGIVYMASPLRRRHAKRHVQLTFALGVYEQATPGIELLDNATAILGEESEPQPDLILRILTAYGGQSRETEKDYIEGPPELVAEVAHSSLAIDLHQKRIDYKQAGVQEYLVLSVEDERLHWFSFKSGREITPNAMGISRSRVYPGLWIDGAALLAQDSARVQEVMQQGLASREHAAFVKRLEAAHRRHTRS
jgi:Uma2 family endonuclease